MSVMKIGSTFDLQQISSLIICSNLMLPVYFRLMKISFVETNQPPFEGFFSWGNLHMTLAAVVIAYPHIQPAFKFCLLLISHVDLPACFVLS